MAKVTYEQVVDAVTFWGAPQAETRLKPNTPRKKRFPIAP